MSSAYDSRISLSLASSAFKFPTEDSGETVIPETQLRQNPLLQNASESTLTTHNELSRLLFDDGFTHYASSQQHPQQRCHASPDLHSVPASSRRTSRHLPNPIQPPTTANSQKISSVKESSSDQHVARASVQHGGFVPGYDFWAANKIGSYTVNHVPSKENGGYAVDGHMDLQSQRRKSESSVLYDLATSDLEYLTLSSIYKPVELQAEHTFLSSPTAFLGSSSLMMSGDSGLQSPHGSAGEVFPGARRSDRFLSEHHSQSPVNQEAISVGTDFRMPGSQPYTLQNGDYPHSQGKGGAFVDRRIRGDPHVYSMCGLCGAQQATIQMGNCSHR